MRWRHEQRARIGDKPARAVERGDEIGTDTPRERRARQRARLPEPRDAGRGERRDDLRRDVEMRERERGQTTFFGNIAVTDTVSVKDVVCPRFRVAREHECRERRGREREPRRVAQIVRAARELRREPPQASEEPQTAADLGQHRVRRRERHRRRELRGPGRDRRERRGLELRITIAERDVGHERKRRRDELAWHDGGGVRGGIRGDDARVMPAGRDGERTRGVGRRERAGEDVERQRRQPQARPQHDARYVRQIVCSDNPISANSAARRCASFAQKNSSSCGGLTGVPASIACACPRWWIWCWNRCASNRVAGSCWMPARRGTAMGRTRSASVSGVHTATSRRSTACCASDSATQVSNGSSGS